jgi:hypothetical protein
MLTLDTTTDEISGTLWTSSNIQRRQLTMSALRKLYGLVPPAILMSALAGCASYGKYGSDSTSDAKVTANVQAAIDRNPALGAPDSIQVQTTDHIVYLNGIVSEGLQSREAEAVAQQTPGVARVVNLLAVAK